MTITHDQAESVFDHIEKSAVPDPDSADRNWQLWQRPRTPEGEKEEAKAQEEAAEAGSALPAEKGGGCKVAIPTGVEKDATPGVEKDATPGVEKDATPGVEKDATPAGTASAKEGGAKSKEGGGAGGVGAGGESAVKIAATPRKMSGRTSGAHREDEWSFAGSTLSSAAKTRQTRQPLAPLPQLQNVPQPQNVQSKEAGAGAKGSKTPGRKRNTAPLNTRDAGVPTGVLPSLLPDDATFGIAPA
ncbi:hypothetical protein T484DRAFT_1921968, partial [Baffinella frigidus]